MSISIRREKRREGVEGDDFISLWAELFSR